MILNNKKVTDITSAIDVVLNGRTGGLLWCDTLEEWLTLPKMGCHILDWDYLFNSGHIYNLCAEHEKHSYYAMYFFPASELRTVRDALEASGMIEWPKNPRLGDTFCIDYKLDPPPADLYSEYAQPTPPAEAEMALSDMTVDYYAEKARKEGLLYVFHDGKMVQERDLFPTKKPGLVERIIEVLS